MLELTLFLSFKTKTQRILADLTTYVKVNVTVAGPFESNNFNTYNLWERMASLVLWKISWYFLIDIKWSETKL